MIARTRGILLLLLFASVGLLAQEPLNNDGILMLVKAKLSDDVIIGMVNQQPGTYTLGVQEVVALKQAGVSDKVLAAMISKNAGGAGAASVANAAAPTASGALAAQGLPTEIGVYHKKDGAWVELFPEVVNWRTGGVLKSVATVGIVKGDLNGRLHGPSSRNTMKPPLEFLIITAEGVSITEYQLLHLRPQKEGREFRTVTGGVFHAAGGSTRDLIPFEGKRVGPRAFTITLTTVGHGEYGFLAPSSDMSTKALSSLGKMFSFRVME
jgi:hypothetical protein